MSKVKLGIIGLGNMGSGHIRSITSGLVPEIELGAVADRLESRRDWVKTVLPEGVPVYEDGMELIKSGKCEAVLIVTPHYEHPFLAIEGFKAGLHVLCEKPAGVYTKQVVEMNKAAKESGKVFAMMFNQRTNSYFRKMHELVQGGSLGAIKRVNYIITNWYRPQVYYDSGDWRATWDGEGGGVLLNQCPHNLDLLQWICGMPSAVRAFCHNGKWHNIEVEDDVTAYLEYPNGATGVFVTTTADAPGSNRLEITLEWGKLLMEDNTNLTLYKLDQNEREFCKTATNGFSMPGITTEKIETDGSNEQHNGILKNFAARILRNEPLIAEGQEGINGLTLSNAMHLSSWLETTVKIPFDDELYLSELNKKRALSKKKEGVNSKVFDSNESFNAR